MGSLFDQRAELLTDPLPAMLDRYVELLQLHAAQLDSGDETDAADDLPLDECDPKGAVRPRVIRCFRSREDRQLQIWVDDTTFILGKTTGDDRDDPSAVFVFRSPNNDVCPVCHGHCSLVQWIGFSKLHRLCIAATISSIIMKICPTCKTQVEGEVCPKDGTDLSSALSAFDDGEEGTKVDSVSLGQMHGLVSLPKVSAPAPEDLDFGEFDEPTAVGFVGDEVLAQLADPNAHPEALPLPTVNPPREISVITAVADDDDHAVARVRATSEEFGEGSSDFNDSTPVASDALLKTVAEMRARSAARTGEVVTDPAAGDPDLVDEEEVTAVKMPAPLVEDKEDTSVDNAAPPKAKASKKGAAELAAAQIAAGAKATAADEARKKAEAKAVEHAEAKAAEEAKAKAAAEAKAKADEAAKVKAAAEAKAKAEQEAKAKAAEDAKAKAATKAKAAREALARAAEAKAAKTKAEAEAKAEAKAKAAAEAKAKREADAAAKKAKEAAGKETEAKIAAAKEARAKELEEKAKANQAKIAAAKEAKAEREKKAAAKAKEAEKAKDAEVEQQEAALLKDLDKPTETIKDLGASLRGALGIAPKPPTPPAPPAPPAAAKTSPSQASPTESKAPDADAATSSTAEADAGFEDFKIDVPPPQSADIEEAASEPVARKKPPTQPIAALSNKADAPKATATPVSTGPAPDGGRKRPTVEGAGVVATPAITATGILNADAAAAERSGATDNKALLDQGGGKFSLDFQLPDHYEVDEPPVSAPTVGPDPDTLDVLGPKRPLWLYGVLAAGGLLVIVLAVLLFSGGDGGEPKAGTTASQDDPKPAASKADASAASARVEKAKPDAAMRVTASKPDASKPDVSTATAAAKPDAKTISAKPITLAPPPKKPLVRRSKKRVQRARVAAGNRKPKRKRPKRPRRRKKKTEKTIDPFAE